MRNGWAGIRGRPPGRAAPGSRPAHGALASASAVRTRIRLARAEGKAPGWPRARGWRRARGWCCRGWCCRGWRPAAVGVRAGTILREAPRRARNRRRWLTRRRLACLQPAPKPACPGLAPGHRRPAAGAGPEPSGLAARTRGGSDFPNLTSGTGLYAADLPPTASHDNYFHLTGHFLYSPQTPVQAHFRQNAILCRSSYFLVHTGWPAV